MQGPKFILKGALFSCCHRRKRRGEREEKKREKKERREEGRRKERKERKRKEEEKKEGKERRKEKTKKFFWRIKFRSVMFFETIYPKQDSDDSEGEKSEKRNSGEGGVIKNSDNTSYHFYRFPCLHVNFIAAIQPPIHGESANTVSWCCQRPRPDSARLPE